MLSTALKKIQNLDFEEELITLNKFLKNRLKDNFKIIRISKIKFGKRNVENGFRF